MSAAYTLDTNITSPNRNVGRAGHLIRHITIHYWGTWVGQSHDSVVDYLSTRRKANATSAHYVVSPGRVSRIVPETDTAWANGHRTANRESVTIELCPDPKRLDATIATCAALVHDIRGRWGEGLPLYPHSHWYDTDCPGPFTNRLDEIDRLARGGKAKKTVPLFPLPKGYYYGPRNSPARSVSGKVASKAVGKDITTTGGRAHSVGLARWQKAVGISADGIYGPKTAAAARKVQKAKGLTVDGLIGARTWAATTW